MNTSDSVNDLISFKDKKIFINLKKQQLMNLINNYLK
jgi:hypothetical protein